MMTRPHLLSLLIISILGLTVVGQEAAALLNRRGPTGHLVLRHVLSTRSSAMAVAVDAAELPAVSSSVLQAEAWLRARVLSLFPSANISAVVVGKGVLCSSHHETKWRLVLPSLKNLYHSLARWGLEKEIKVSAAFSTECLRYDTVPAGVLRPLLSFLTLSNSFYLVDPSTHFSPSSESTHSLVSPHRVGLGKWGFSQLLEHVWLIEEEKPISRKLSSFFSTPYPERPKPTAFPLSGHSGDNPNPPSPFFASAPDGSFSFVPVESPSEVPENPPNAFSGPPLPPCSAAPAIVPLPPLAPAPREEEKGGLWCVAKPTVPLETLQEAMDYACGEGGADCEEIKPHGSCYYPDNVISHASFAFNSYWQKTKGSGGSCYFEGTAVLINSDPSFLQCRFVLRG